jgi:hypothetical protein
MEVEMKTSAAGANEVGTNKIDYAQVSEAELLRLAVASDDGAWRELLRRYGKTVRGRIQWVALKFDSILPSDAVEEMEQEFWCSLVWNDYAKLRAYKPKRGRRKTLARLASWLSMLAVRSALTYVHKSFHREETGIVDDILRRIEGDDEVEAD